MDKPEATRYTLDPAPGMPCSHFGLGVRMAMSLYAFHKKGRPMNVMELTKDSGVAFDTLKKVLGFESATVEAATLEKIASALGYKRWEMLDALGMRSIAFAADQEKRREQGAKP